MDGGEDTSTEYQETGHNLHELLGCSQSRNDTQAKGETWVAQHTHVRNVIASDTF